MYICVFGEKRTKIENGIMKMYTGIKYIPLHLSDLNSSANVRHEFWSLFQNCSSKIAKILQFSHRFVLKLNQILCRNFVRISQIQFVHKNAARINAENVKKIAKNILRALELSSI